MQSVFGTMMTVAKGTSLIQETIFEKRFKYLDELFKMGAKSNIIEKTAEVKGIRRLHSAKVTATDLRGGISLVIAGLNAHGITEVGNIEYILRGYENLEEKIRKLGGKIRRSR